jgi:hypothetical protein
VAAALNASIVQALASPDAIKRYEEQGFTAISNTSRRPIQPNSQR